MLAATVYAARGAKDAKVTGDYRNYRFTHPQVGERLRVASVFAIKGDSSSLKRNSPARWYVSGFDSSGAPVWRHRKSINDAAPSARHRHRRKSFPLGIVEVLLAVVYVRPTLQNIVLRNILGLTLHPYCFSLRWRGIRLFYYTIFVANLEKFCVSFFSLFRIFFVLPPLRLLPVFATSIPFRMSSPYSSR